MKKGLLLGLILLLSFTQMFASGFEKKVLKTAEKLMEEMETPKDIKVKLISNIEWGLENKKFLEELGDQKVQGVFLYSSGEGGFLVKGIKGKGVLKAYKKSKQQNFKVHGVSGGAVIGGGKMWSVGIIIGDIDLTEFSGTYNGAVAKATAAKSNSYLGTFLYPKGKTKKKAEHFIYLISSGAGATADAGGLSLTFVPQD